MRKVLTALVIAWACSYGIASAQGVEPQFASVRPYMFVAPGAIDAQLPTLELGGGVEVVGPRGVGASFDLGYLGPFQDFSYGIGLLSMNAVYHFNRARRASAPFLTGGYTTTIIRGGQTSLLNVGVGFERQLASGTVFRLEVRDHFLVSLDHHLFGVRIGARWGR